MHEVFEHQQNVDISKPNARGKNLTDDMRRRGGINSASIALRGKDGRFRSVKQTTLSDQPQPDQQPQ